MWLSARPLMIGTCDCPQSRIRAPQAQPSIYYCHIVNAETVLFGFPTKAVRKTIHREKDPIGGSNDPKPYYGHFGFGELVVNPATSKRQGIFVPTGRGKGFRNWDSGVVS